ncbi:MAG: LysR family transcriptional regulator [Burkholderiaceae bacterium]|nr:LysR family transcriptional regulator [Burkholderiaceae bacterium]
MKLDQLRRMALFAMVAQQGSFTAVSQQQNIATSAISAAISQLESEIGTRLLHRTTRKISLTDAGAVFLIRCQAMLFEANTAHEELAQMVDQLVGTLTITASQWQADVWLLPALTPLLQANPNLRLHLLVNDRRLDLVENNIDIAIRSGVLADSSLIARPLANLPEWVVAAPRYLAQNRTPQNIHDLNQHRIIAFTPFEHPQHIKLIDANGVPQTAQLSMGAQTDSVEMVRQLAVMGLGIARLPQKMVEQELARGQLVQVLPQYSLPAIKVYAMTSKRDLQPAKVLAALVTLHDFMAQV